MCSRTMQLLSHTCACASSPLQAQGVRLNPTTERLLQLGRRRAQERADAMAGTDL